MPLFNFFRKKPKPAKEETLSMEDVMVPIQHLVNTVVSITENSGVSIEQWSMADMSLLLASFDRFGRLVETK